MRGFPGKRCLLSSSFCFFLLFFEKKRKKQRNQDRNLTTFPFLLFLFLNEKEEGKGKSCQVGLWAPLDPPLTRARRPKGGNDRREKGKMRQEEPPQGPQTISFLFMWARAVCSLLLSPFLSFVVSLLRARKRRDRRERRGR